MRLRTRTTETLPGVHGTARVDRRAAALLGRLERGDVVVLDHVDLDRATAERLVEAEVAAVVNAQPMISGRFPNLGPRVLLDAGVTVVDGVGAAALADVREGRTLRVHEGEVWDGETLVASGREQTTAQVDDQLAAARTGMVAQLDTFTRTSSELLREEQDLLLHGEGFPTLRTRLAGRPVVVVTTGPDHADELRGLRRFLAESDAVLVGVDGGADLLRERGHQPDVVVLSGGSAADDRPSSKTLKAARDVVVRTATTGTTGVLDQLERAGARPVAVATGAAAADLALLLADHEDAAVVIGVGMHVGLEEFLDSHRTGTASAYLARLKVGSRLVDAGAVPRLYDGRVRPRHLFWVVLAGLAALAVAVATTPVGQEWSTDLLDTLTGWWTGTARPALSDLLDAARGLLP